MELNIENLENCFNAALKNKAKYVAVKLKTKMSKECEIMITPYESITTKLKNYKEIFNYYLELEAYNGIKIVGFTYGNTFKEIEHDLCFDQ